jgi:CcmD family protein
MENFSYLLAAYSIIFAAIFFYVVFIWRRQSRIETDVRTLEARLEEVRGELAARPSAPSRPAAS